MIKYIFKSTSGSFFRTIGRILAYVLIGIIVLIFSNYINILNVSAKLVDYKDFSQATTFDFLNCQSNDNCWHSYGATYETDSINSNEFSYYKSKNKLNSIPNSSGIGIVFSTDKGFIKDNIYTISILVSGRVSMTAYTTNNRRIGTGINLQDAYDNKANYIDHDSNSNYSLVLNGTSFSPATGPFSFLIYTFKANKSGNYVFLTFTSSKTITDYVSFYGYHYIDHGNQAPSTDDIKNALNSSFNTINNNINNVQNSINNNIDDMKQKQDETNSYLKDETPPDADISSLGTVQGLLPPGPVDSLLNIPFKFLSVLTSSMVGVCTPITGNFVFDSTLTLPCFSELIWDNNSVPSELLNWLSLIPSAFILIKYFKHLYKKVDRAVSMETSSDDEWGVI